MRTWISILVVTVFLGACAKSKPQTAPKPVPASVSQVVVPPMPPEPPTVTAADEKKLSEDPEEKVVRLRAEKIRLERELKEAKEKLREKDTDDMKEARRQIEKEVERNEDQRKYEVKVFGKAAISGCDPKSMFVHGGAVDSSRMAVMASVRITNRRPFPVDIETPFRGIGVAVRNLCPMGSITLSFARSWLPDSQSEDVPLSAVSRPQGAPIILDSFVMRLDSNNITYRRVETLLWGIGGY